MQPKTIPTIKGAITGARKKTLSKLSRSGCLSSLLDQHSAIDEDSATVLTISGDNLLETMDDSDNCNDHHCIINSSQSLTHNMEPTTAIECVDERHECAGWGQFVDVIPVEPIRKRRLGGTSRFGMRYSPYSTVSRGSHDDRRRDPPKMDWGFNCINDVGTTMNHSPSTDCISSALYKVQLA